MNCQVGDHPVLKDGLFFGGETDCLRREVLITRFNTSHPPFIGGAGKGIPGDVSEGITTVPKVCLDLDRETTPKMLLFKSPVVTIIFLFVWRISGLIYYRREITNRVLRARGKYSLTTRLNLMYRCNTYAF